MFNKSKLIIIICLISGTAKSATGSIAQSAKSAGCDLWERCLVDGGSRWADHPGKDIKEKVIPSKITTEEFNKILEMNLDDPGRIVEAIFPFISLCEKGFEINIIYKDGDRIMFTGGPLRKSFILYFYKHEGQVFESCEYISKWFARYANLILPAGLHDAAENKWKGERCTIVIKDGRLKWSNEVFSHYDSWQKNPSWKGEDDLIIRIAKSLYEWGIVKRIQFPHTYRFGAIRLLSPELEDVIGFNLVNYTREGSHRGSTTPVSINAERNTKGDITKVTLEIGETVFDSREDLPKWPEKKPNRCQGSNILREEEQVAEQDEGQSKGRK